ncbi:MAG: conserved rane protein of unknown function [Crocinitomicaceae bacterium]|jgi:hypothetical protein|nr:conserved rane protein of unknown function [Crocinitomicaceae bacterium]
MKAVKDLLKRLPFHPFLFLPYVIFFTITKNYKDISLYMSVRPLVIGLVCTLILFFLIKLFLKENVKTAIMTSIVLLFFSTYGVRYDMLEDIYYAGYWPFKHIHRFLVAFDMILVTLIFFRFRKLQKKLSGLNAFMNVTLIFLISYNMFICLYNYSQMKSHGDVTVENSSSKEYPNIYYFILDGYANNITLKKHYNFDNKKFLSYLKYAGFYVQDTSYSNFYGTNLSLGSTLNMDYGTKKVIYDNTVFETLKKNGYHINVIKSGYTVTANFKDVDNLFQPEGMNELERTLLEHTILRLDDIIGGAVYGRLKSQMSSIDLFITKKKNQFTFVHIVAPHPPYVFNRDGKKTFNINKSVNNWEPKEKYLDQLIYVSRVIKGKIKKIKAVDPDAIIILQSDHGPYITSKKKEEVFESRALILNAVYGPEELKKEFRKTNSSVNTFIHVFNYLFDSKIPLSSDELAGKEEFMNSVTFKNKLLK